MRPQKNKDLEEKSQATFGSAFEWDLGCQSWQALSFGHPSVFDREPCGPLRYVDRERFVSVLMASASVATRSQFSFAPGGGCQNFKPPQAQRREGKKGVGRLVPPLAHGWLLALWIWLGVVRSQRNKPLTTLGPLLFSERIDPFRRCPGNTAKGRRCHFEPTEAPEQRRPLAHPALTAHACAGVPRKSCGSNIWIDNPLHQLGWTQKYCRPPTNWCRMWSEARVSNPKGWKTCSRIAETRQF